MELYRPTGLLFYADTHISWFSGQSYEVKLKKFGDLSELRGRLLRVSWLAILSLLEVPSLLEAPHM